MWVSSVPGAVVRRLGYEALLGEAVERRRRSYAAAVALQAMLRLGGRESRADLVQTVTLVMCAARDARVSAAARHALERGCHDQRVLRTVLGAFTTAGNIGLRGGQRAPLSAAAVDFLFAPVVEGSRVPRVRLVSHLASELQPRSAPPSTGHKDVARWILECTLTTTDETVREMAVGVLRRTDEPHLLDALERAFTAGADIARREGRGDPSATVARRYRLWQEGEPTLLTRIVEANPYLPLSLEGTTPGDYVGNDGVLLAVLKGRSDVVRQYFDVRGVSSTIAALLDGTNLPAPPAFRRQCRAELRALPPGPAQDELCRRAMRAGREARQIVLKAGYLPSRDVVPFLYLTGQWDRYDEADPDGSQMSAWCAEHARDYGYTFRQRVELVARRHRRPNPCPPLPEVPAPATRLRSSSSGGSAPTSDFDSGGSDAGHDGASPGATFDGGGWG
jgi:hypothetical protein